MAANRRQLDLLTDWEPSPATVRFAPEQVRAASLQAAVCKAISAALAETPKSREEIVESMTAYLGARVSLNILNAYTSQARAEHTVPLIRYIALLNATRDRRLLEFIAEMFGWAVIERRHLPLIELAQVQERMDDLRKHADALKRQAKTGGNS